MSKLVKNTIFVTGGNTLNKIISFFSVPIIARLLGTEGFGAYTLVFSFVMLFSGISDVGLENLTIRDVSRDKTLLNKFLSNSLFLRFLITFLIYFLIILTAKFLNYPEEIFQLIAILGIIILANFLINTLNAVIISLEKMEISSSVLVLQNMINPITAVIMLYLKFDLKSIFLTIIIINLLLALIYFFLINKLLLKIKWEIDFKFWKYLFINALPFAIINILSFVYLYNGIIILSKLQSIETVGIYNAAFKLILALSFIPSSLILVFFPTFARQSIEKIRINIKNSCQNALRALFLFAFPVAIVFTLFSQFIIDLLFGKDFSQAAPVLAILGWVMLLIFIASPLGLTIINSKFLNKFIYLFASLTIFAIILNVVFITQFSFYGMALSILLTELIRFFAYLIFIKKYWGFKIDIFRILSKPTILGIMIVPFILLLKFFPIHSSIIIIFSAIFYLLLLFITKEYILMFFIKKILSLENALRNNNS